jgi:hypothetical protein
LFLENQFTFGQSNPTFLIVAESEPVSSNNYKSKKRKFVMRKKPPGKLLQRFVLLGAIDKI